MEGSLSKRAPKTHKKVKCFCHSCEGKLVDERTKKSHASREMVSASLLIEQNTTKNQNSRFANNSIIHFTTHSTHRHLNNISMEIPLRQRNHKTNCYKVSADHVLPEGFMVDMDLDISCETNSTHNLNQMDEQYVDCQSDGENDVEEHTVIETDEECGENFSEFPACGSGRSETLTSEYNEADFHLPDTNDITTWVLIWLTKYQERFRLSDVALECLIKFINYLLKSIDTRRFNKFPCSLFRMRNYLNILQKPKVHVACEGCHKLYTVAEVSGYTKNGLREIKTCDYIEFPNHRNTVGRSACNKPLAELCITQEGTYSKPLMIHPTIPIHIKLQQLYHRPGFEKSLRHWNRRQVFEHLSDIYDAQVWKEFRLYPNDSEPFFHPKYADSHLGLMINMDWFQPFSGKVYSIGAIYCVICNLPREERFKPHNIMLLGIIPGPREPHNHQINHYLKPIVDQLLQLSAGIKITTAENPSGKLISAALICLSCDVPAARKAIGFASANSACYRCYKKSQQYNYCPSFAGFDDMEEWFIERSLDEYRKAAEEWKLCDSHSERKNHISKKGARWSELLRLPYFNPIRMTIVDPMHCLFLGIAKWLVKRCWIENGILSPASLELIQNRLSSINVPSDIGRLPNKIAVGDGFSELTADQWKNFIMIYAIPVLWDILPSNDRYILIHFFLSCTLLTSRIISEQQLAQAQHHLLEVAKRIESCYGPKYVSPNIHLSLHITQCCRDFGPLYSFWCFSFERYNGILGALPNSNRRIEGELMRMILQQIQVDEILSNIPTSDFLSQSLELLAPRRRMASLDVVDQMQTYELQQFLRMSRAVETEGAVGYEQFPGEMVSPVHISVRLPSNLHKFLLEYYCAAYPEFKFRKPGEIYKNEQYFDYGYSQSSIIVHAYVDQFARLRIGTETFGSQMDQRFAKSAYILARWVQIRGEGVETFPGEVQFYFEHLIDIPRIGKRIHRFAYVKWFESDCMRHSYAIGELESGIEIWSKGFYEEGRDSILPVHSILSRFVAGSIKMGRGQNLRERLIVIPLNSRFHL